MGKNDSLSTHKYRQIYNELRRDIVLDKYPAGALLPSEAELMQMFSASRNTVRHAVRLLRESGLVSSLRGSGVTVLPNGHKYGADGSSLHSSVSLRAFSVEHYSAAGDGSVIVSSAPAADKVPAPQNVAAAFGLPEGTLIYRLQRIWKIDGAPFTYMVQYFNGVLLPGLLSALDDHVASIYRVITEKYGLSFLSGKETISCINADFLKANLLNVELGAALLHTVRTASCETGVFEYADIFANPQYTGYSVDVSPNTTLFAKPDK